MQCEVMEELYAGESFELVIDYMVAFGNIDAHFAGHLPHGQDQEDELWNGEVQGSVETY